MFIVVGGTNLGILLQPLFNTCMMGASAELRANLTFEMAKRTITSARTRERPGVPVKFKDLLKRFDDRDYPQRFLDLFLGKTVMKIGGK